DATVTGVQTCALPISLALAPREAHAALTDEGLVALGKARNEFVRIGRLCRFLYFIQARLRTCVGDVLCNTAREKHGLLLDKSELFSQIAQPVVPKIHIIEESEGPLDVSHVGLESRRVFAHAF